MTLEQLNAKRFPTTAIQDENLRRLLFILNIVESQFGHAFVVTSGLRNLREQAKIDEAAGRKVTLGSAHIKGCAADLEDKDGSLKRWIMCSLSLFKSQGCYFEDFEYTPGWVHIQTYAPKSGKMFFIPY